MTTQVEAAAVTEALKIVRLNYGHLAGMILFFDHLITLDIEINLLWRRGKSFSAYWFFINRYFGFLSGIAVLALPFLTVSPETCQNYSFIRELILVATQAIASTIMVLRVYALYGRSRRVLWFLCVLALGLVAISVFSFTQQQAIRATILGGCHFNLSEKTSYHLASSWEALFIFDTAIFILTIYNAYTTRRRMMPTASLYTRIIHDGAIVMALANLVNIATFYFADSVSIFPGGFATVASTISITMISRLILNLHEHANAGLMTQRSGPVSQYRIPLQSLPDSSTFMAGTVIDSQLGPILNITVV
ncbi:hypothetical protein DFH08DRAFT_967038 [Mycena albidolilacea]|uniref:DUF6533 domain-containing protein n=1 Tax=Mycena albidolilacea TaxID=1033008 RepID=A0AAD6ZN96_9AGAR|nr:hypothetical protein DFH08DRAFT_967038 [Mycena albidolilacea]